MFIRWKTAVMIQSEIGFTIGCGKAREDEGQLKMQKENQRWIVVLRVEGNNLQTEGQIKKHEVKLHLNHTLLWKQIPSGNFPFEKQTPAASSLACVLKRMCMYMCV